jgi:hypothetical protein
MYRQPLSGSPQKGRVKETVWVTYMASKTVIQLIMILFISLPTNLSVACPPPYRGGAGGEASKVLGQLVRLGFDVTVFTPAAYQRRRLRRPSMELSSRGGLRT